MHTWALTLGLFWGQTDKCWRMGDEQQMGYRDVGAETGSSGLELMLLSHCKQDIRSQLWLHNSIPWAV